MQKSKFSRYNDGIVSIYRENEDNKSDFSAKRNIATLSDMQFIVRLAFEECAKREQDITFAEQHDFTLTTKVKTRLVAGVDNKCKAVIDNYLYAVSYIDKSREEMWLYLQGVKSLDS